MKDYEMGRAGQYAPAVNVDTYRMLSGGDEKLQGSPPPTPRSRGPPPPLASRSGDPRMTASQTPVAPESRRPTSIPATPACSPSHLHLPGLAAAITLTASPASAAPGGGGRREPQARPSTRPSWLAPPTPYAFEAPRLGASNGTSSAGASQADRLRLPLHYGGCSSGGRQPERRGGAGRGGAGPQAGVE
ncbi:hypothetical protein P7K49_015460 [Saguinus oedipus]|uniref:Uncharacterized protein n=1 Tax=Saguinus oedipus TaxID=9490 RepID=A0ABQ9V9M7_SAGOE|nr:hypothetical protein P7K49_015460 [Saguinus oedipus]